MNLHHTLEAALPRVQATEALEYHLQCAGLNTRVMAAVADDGNDVAVVLFVSAPYRHAINAIEHAGLDARFVSESRSDLVDVRTYESTVLGQSVAIVIQPPRPLQEVASC